MGKLNILLQSQFSDTSYSGGRYYSWLMAESLAHLGHNVSVWTNNKPYFIDDFSVYPRHNSIHLHIDPYMLKYPRSKFDIVVVVPHLTNDLSFFKRALIISKKNNAKTVLLNFESPNWFNKYAPVPRDPQLWNGWYLISKYADLVFSISKQGLKYAKDYYNNVQKHTMFCSCYPAINSYIADSVKNNNNLTQVLCITRFSDVDVHKGAYDLFKLLSPTLEGYTLALLIGSSKIDMFYYCRLIQEAQKYNIKIKLLKKLTDKEKFEEISKSKFMVFFSHFEGFGYPPVESQYCNVPCIVYDLPVLKEVNGNSLMYIKPGSEKELQTCIDRILQNNYKSPVSLSGNAQGKFKFEVHNRELNLIINNMMQDKNTGISRLNIKDVSLWQITTQLFHQKHEHQFIDSLKSLLWIISTKMYFHLFSYKPIRIQKKASPLSEFIAVNSSAKMYEILSHIIFESIDKKYGPFYIALPWSATTQNLLLNISSLYAHRINWEKVHIFYSNIPYIEQNSPPGDTNYFHQVLINKINAPNVYHLDQTTSLNKTRNEYKEKMVEAFHLKNNEIPIFDIIVLDKITLNALDSSNEYSAELSKETHYNNQLFVKSSNGSLTLSPSILSSSNHCLIISPQLKNRPQHRRESKKINRFFTKLNNTESINNKISLFTHIN